MTEFLVHFGYLAIFLGTFLEGETVLVVAGFLAKRGYFDIHLVILAAMFGTMFGDQLYFLIGRTHGMAFLDKRPRWKRKLGRAMELIRHHELLIILTFRFLYGLRNITPLALGISGTKPRLFIPLNVIAAAVWATAVGFMGYGLGSLATSILGRTRKYELMMAGAIVLAGAVVVLVQFLRSRRDKASRQ